LGHSVVQLVKKGLEIFINLSINEKIQSWMESFSTLLKSVSICFEYWRRSTPL